MNYQWGCIFSALPNMVLVNSKTQEVELGLTELESQVNISCSLSLPAPRLPWLLLAPLLLLLPHFPSSLLTHLFTNVYTGYIIIVGVNIDSYLLLLHPG